LRFSNPSDGLIRGLSGRPKEIRRSDFPSDREWAFRAELSGLPEWTLDRQERSILETFSEGIAALLGPRPFLVACGGLNTGVLLARLDRPSACAPVAPSEAVLDGMVHRLRSDCPQLPLFPVVGDPAGMFPFPSAPPETERTVGFIGGGILGGVTPPRARAWLREWSRRFGRGGGLLVGVDLKKPVPMLEAAYNDGREIRKRLVLDLLPRINLQVGTNFDPAGFRYSAFFNPIDGRVEVTLVSSRPQTVTLQGREIFFEAEERVLTEVAYQYDLEGFRILAESSGWSVGAVWSDPEEFFGLHYLISRGMGGFSELPDAP